MAHKTITHKQEVKLGILYCQGLTGKEISDKLGISLKQIYSSLRRQGIPRKNLWEQNRVLFLRKELTFSFKENLSPKERELMIAAVMIYYGEGAKTGSTVDLVNSDPQVAKLFLKFLRNICNVKESKLRFYLYCFSDQDPYSLIQFWSAQLSVEPVQFTKPHVRSTLNRGKRTMPHGVIHVRYNDKKLLEKILSLCYSLVQTI